QHDPKDHVVQHRVGGDVDEIAAVVERDEADSGGQDAATVDAGDLALDAGDDGQRLLALAHEHDALDDIDIAIPAGDPEPGRVPNLGAPDVAEEHRRAPALRQHDVADVVDVPDEADAADVGRLLADVGGAGPDVHVAVGDGGDRLRQRDAVPLQLSEIDLDVVLLRQSAPADDVDHPRH